MTTLENATSRRATRTASSASPDTEAYGDHPTTSSVNRVRRSTDAPPTSASSAFSSTSLRDSLITVSILSFDAFQDFWQSGLSSGPEDLRLGGRELLVCERAGGVELREVLDLVCRVCRWRRILGWAVVDRVLIGV